VRGIPQPAQDRYDPRRLRPRLRENLVWTLPSGGEQSMHQQADKGQERQAGDYFGQAFVIVGKATEAAGLGE
jgi:hypothetical protein